MRDIDPLWVIERADGWQRWTGIINIRKSRLAALAYAHATAHNAADAVDIRKHIDRSTVFDQSVNERIPCANAYPTRLSSGVSNDEHRLIYPIHDMTGYSPEDPFAK